MAREAAEARKRLGDSAAAFIECKDFVKARLKAPSTAKFPWFEYDATADDNGNWLVKSHVDSQNSFGAMLRMQYLCTVRHLGDNRWKLISLDTK